MLAAYAITTARRASHVSRFPWASPSSFGESHDPHIWVSARCTELLLDRNADNINQSPYNITKLDLGSLKEVLSPLNYVRNVTLSMPLAQVSEPEDGYVVENAHLRIWRRGVGDRYHPALSPIIEVARLSSNTYLSTKRYVS